MSIVDIQHRELKNIYPFTLIDKEKFHLDLMNLSQSWTGRDDAMYSNDFFEEANQLIVNSMCLFEQGYFDCAFYSLRQSLEIVTTVVYFVDDDSGNRSKQMTKWKNQDVFPLHGQMLNELKQRRKEFADIRNRMDDYFRILEETKNKLNKYVHKQGFDKFYTYQKYPTPRNTDDWRNQLTADFITYLKVCIGAVAIFRLAIDPLPVLLADEDIYNRTGEFVTEGYSLDFMEEYIGLEHIKSYKTTDMYKDFYKFYIGNEEMYSSVSDLVKNQYIDRSKIDEIISQKHLLSPQDLVAIDFISISEKIAKVYCYGGFPWYWTNVKTVRKANLKDSLDFNVLKGSSEKSNKPYGEAFLTYIEIQNVDYYLEHNEIFSDEEIEKLVNIYIDKVLS